MKDIFGGYMSMALTMLEDMKTQQEAYKKRILSQWEDSRNLPRKKKKALRKRLQLEWSIACYNPLEF